MLVSLSFYLLDSPTRQQRCTSSSRSLTKPEQALSTECIRPNQRAQRVNGQQSSKMQCEWNEQFEFIFKFKSTRSKRFQNWPNESLFVLILFPTTMQMVVDWWENIQNTCLSGHTLCSMHLLLHFHLPFKQKSFVQMCSCKKWTAFWLGMACEKCESLASIGAALSPQSTSHMALASIEVSIFKSTSFPVQVQFFSFWQLEKWKITAETLGSIQFWQIKTFQTFKKSMVLMLLAKNAARPFWKWSFQTLLLLGKLPCKATTFCIFQVVSSPFDCPLWLWLCKLCLIHLFSKNWATKCAN